MFVHFTTYDIKHSPPKNTECSIKTKALIFLWSFKIHKKIYFMVFGNLVVWLWKSFQVVVKGVRTSPDVMYLFIFIRI